MLLLAGLGNPGAQYAWNRHNIGYMALDSIVQRHQMGAYRRRFRGLITHGRIAGVRLAALKPTTFMNDSGSAVGEAARFFKVPTSAVVVVHDDLDLVPGKVRVKTGGGHGGHNGLRSIDRHIGPDYKRVRIGIGHPGEKRLVHDYVLHDFATADQDWLDRLLPALAEAAPYLVRGDDSGFMNKVSLLTNPRPAPPPSPGSDDGV
ncbi:MAG: aminoacyl-tRNA hydrolase [Alphaproteobacteria bacterium]|nr:aminoacyl-tRNA hydrolase [Alphaproteobacteria bacterium]MDP6516944.1 aminoacyl-tRNA hydrolase [Alphaproteobacteria bacterium]